MKYPWEFIQPYDSPIGGLKDKEKDLELFRVCARPRGSAEFVDAQLSEVLSLFQHLRKRATTSFLMSLTPIYFCA